MPKTKMKKNITNFKGSKDGRSWEEVVRKEHGSEYNRFSNQQYIRNLTLLQKWCEKKIRELTKKEKGEEE